MELYPFFISAGRCTIGAKASFVGDDRSEGHNGSYSEFRRALQLQDCHRALCNRHSEGPVYVPDGERVRPEDGPCGACSLGLSVVEYRDDEPEVPEGCSYSPAVFAGWAARVVRNGKRRNLKA